MKKIKLNDENKLPMIGYGTWKLSGDKLERGMKYAIDLGMRHIDTATVYDNEEEIGNILTKCNVDRCEFFITTKIPDVCKQAKEVFDCVNESLRLLQTDYLDLVLIHAPKSWDLIISGDESNYDIENVEAWNALINLKKVGKVKSIGVSNFGISDIENLINNTNVVPAVNQIPVSVDNYDQELINYCKSKGIVVCAYSPLGSGQLKNNKDIIKFAEDNNMTWNQYCLKYLLDDDIIPIFSSTSKNNIQSNIDVLNFDV